MAHVKTFIHMMCLVVVEGEGMKVGVPRERENANSSMRDNPRIPGGSYIYTYHTIGIGAISLSLSSAVVGEREKTWYLTLIRHPWLDRQTDTKR